MNTPALSLSLWLLEIITIRKINISELAKEPIRRRFCGAYCFGDLASASRSELVIEPLRLVYLLDEHKVTFAIIAA